MPRDNMGTTSSQIEPQVTHKFKAGSLESSPAMQRVPKYEAVDDDYAASQQLVGESEAGDVEVDVRHEADDELPNGKPQSSASNTSTSARRNKKNWKAPSAPRKAGATAATSPHSAQHPLPATLATASTAAHRSASLPNRVRARAREPTPSVTSIPSSPPSLAALDSTFEGWLISPPPTQTPRSLGDDATMVQVLDSQVPATGPDAEHEEHDLPHEQELDEHQTDTQSSKRKKNKRKLYDVIAHDGPPSKKVKKASRTEPILSHIEPDTEAPTQGAGEAMAGNGSSSKKVKNRKRRSEATVSQPEVDTEVLTQEADETMIGDGSHKKMKKIKKSRKSHAQIIDHQDTAGGYSARQTPNALLPSQPQSSAQLQSATTIENDIVLPTSLLGGLKARRAAELNDDVNNDEPFDDAGQGHPLVFDKVSHSPDHKLPSSHQGLPSSHQDLPPPHQDLPLPSKKKSKKSRKSKKRRESEQVLEDRTESEQIPETENAMIAESTNVEVEVEVEATPEVEETKDGPAIEAATVFKKKSGRSSIKKNSRRDSHVSGLIGAEKELATKRILSNPPDLRSEGQWSGDEQELIRRAIADYKRRHRLDVEELVNMIQFSREYGSGESHKTKRKRVDETRGMCEATAVFWKELCEHLPDRNKAAIRKTVRAKYHANKGGGGWEQEEDQMLKELYEEYPNQWTVIAQQLSNRDAQSCALRWKNYVQHGTKRNTKRWSVEEEIKLRQAVRDATDRSTQEVNWGNVCEIMGTRSRVQIAQKWKKMQNRGKRSKQERYRQSVNSAVEADGLDALKGKKPRTRRPTIGIGKMLMGDKFDVLESITFPGRPTALETINWHEVSSNLRGSYWSAEDCEDCFKVILADIGKEKDFDEAIDAIMAWVEGMPVADLEVRYDPAMEDEDVSPKKQYSNEFITASDEEM